MVKQPPKRKRSASAFALDKRVDETCKRFILNDKSISARAIAKELGKSTTTISRDSIRSRIIAVAKRQQKLVEETTRRQTKSARSQDAKTISKLRLEIECLERKNLALLKSHKALYNVIREIGGAEAWERFFAEALEVRRELIDMGATGGVKPTQG